MCFNIKKKSINETMISANFEIVEKIDNFELKTQL